MMSSYPLRLLGPGQISDQAGQAIALRSRKQLALLAYLATEHQNAHSRETLLALLWPTEATPTAHNNLRVTLSRLRTLPALIAATGAPPVDLLIADRQHVQLQPAWVACADVNRFQQLLEQTRQHEHSSRSQCAACQAALAAAVQLYQGDFLAGLGLEDCSAFEEWLFLQRERLRLLALEAYSDLATYAETSGDLTTARHFAQRQIELDPLREPAYRQQMRLLIRLGERSAALATFERCRALLNNELGLDPEPETLALHRQLLTGALTTPVATALPPRIADEVSRKPQTPRHNLPQQLTPFIGRETEIEQLQARLADPAYRLLSLVGPGGIGKSRLAQQVAARQLDRFSDGVYFVALAQVPTVEAIPATIAETLRLSFAAGQKNPVEQLIEMIAAKHLLLVLDNFEHLMAGVDLLMEILHRAPQVVLLVTSREGLNLQAEDLFELQGLPTPSRSSDAAASTYAAVRLFVDRAHRLDKHFKATAEQLPHIVRICQMVEGFPLALELAATWVRDLTCQEIVTELAAGLDLLETTLHDIDPQHRSLRTVFNSSWTLLSPVERRTLARLAVFRGGFTLEAARTIADASPVLISGLRNKSLLSNAGSRRYDMHALVQQFSVEALANDADDAERVRQAHSQYFLRLLADQAIALDTSAARAAADKIQPDWENIAVAWQQATTQANLQLLHNALDGLVRFCNLRGLFQEAQTLLEWSLAHVGHTDNLLLSPSELRIANWEAAGALGARNSQFAIRLEPDRGSPLELHLRCRLLTAQAYFAGRCGLDQTRALAQKALGLAQQIDSPLEIISNYIIQADSCELTADYPQGIALAKKALQLAEADQLELQVGLCWDVLGRIAYATGEYAHATTLFQRVLAIHEKTGRIEQRGRAAIGRLGSVAIEQGRYEVALHYGRLYLESCAAIDDRRNLAHALHHWAYLWLRLGDFAKAISFEEQSLVRASQLGDREISSFGLQVKSWAHRHAGQLPQALACAREAVVLAQALDAQLALSYGLHQLAEAQLALAQNESDWANAAANFRETATRLRAIGKGALAYEAEIGLAELLRRRGEIENALQLIQPILLHLPNEAAEGWDEPIRAYVVCIQILRAVDDPAAETLLDHGLQLLDCLAQQITDRALRQNFLEANPAHRELRGLRFGE